jgi:cytochrome c peroxidase
MFGLPLLRGSTRNTGDDAGKGYVTMYCYANIGFQKIIDNPYYQHTDKESNPHGYNSLETKFYKNVPGDIPEFRGLFKAPSVRGTNKRPSPDFVKAYVHNGIFKSLKDVVHFYNKRNFAVNANGKEIAFDLPKRPSVRLHSALSAARGPRQTLRTSPESRPPRQLPRPSPMVRSAICNSTLNRRPISSNS